MSTQLLQGKRGIIFGALDPQSIAWKVAEHCVDQGAKITFTNTPVALRFGQLDELAKKLDPEMDREQITNALKDLLGDEDSFKQFFAAVEEQGKKVANEELAKFQDANPSEAVSSNAETQDNKADLQVEFEHGMTRHDLSKIVNWLEPTS